MPDTSTAKSAYLAGGNKRTTNIGAQVEYVDSTNYRRTTNIGAQVEYQDTTNYRRITNIGVQVEYIPLQVSSKGAYTAGGASSNHAQACYLAGSQLGSTSLPAFVASDAITTGNRAAYTNGVLPEEKASQLAFLTGDVLATSSQPAFLTSDTGQPAIAWAELETPFPPTNVTATSPAYLQGSDQATTSNPAYLSGALGSSGSAAAYMVGQATISASKAAYLNGSTNAVLASLPGYLGGQATAIASLPAYLQSGLGKASQAAYLSGPITTDTETSHGAYLKGGHGTFPISISSGTFVDVFYQGAALITTSGGTKYAVYVASNYLEIYKHVDGVPVRVGHEYYTTVGNDLSGIAAALDANDKIHVVVLDYNGTGARWLSYRVFGTGNDSWEGSWTEAISKIGNGTSYTTLYLAIDSNAKPHVVLSSWDSSWKSRIYYTEKTGSNWSSAVEISTSGGSPDCHLFGMTMLQGDDIQVTYNESTLNNFCYVSKISGTWGSVQNHSMTVDDYSLAVAKRLQSIGSSIYRYHLHASSTYFDILEGDTDLGFDVDRYDSQHGFFSIVNLTAFPNHRFIIFRSTDYKISLAVYNGSTWSTSIVNDAQPLGLHTEYDYYQRNSQSIGFLYGQVSGIYYDEIWTPEKSSLHAYLEGYANQSSIHAYLEGLLYLSSVHAYLKGEVGNSTPAYLCGGTISVQAGYADGVQVGSSLQSGYLFSSDTALSDNSAYTSGNIASVSNLPAYASGSSSTPWKQAAYLAGIETNHNHAYLEGQVISRSYIRVRLGQQSFQFIVLSENYSDGELAPSMSLARTLSGGIDMSTGARYRQWVPVIRCSYNDFLNLETIFASGENWLYEDHFGVEHNVAMVGDVRKSVIGTVIEGNNSLFIVRVTFVEVL